MFRVEALNPKSISGFGQGDAAVRMHPSRSSVTASFGGLRHSDFGF